MTRLRKLKRASLILALTAFALVAIASWFGDRPAPNAGSHPPDAYPELFVDSRDCPQRGDVFENGRRLEEHSDEHRPDSGVCSGRSTTPRRLAENELARNWRGDSIL